MLLPSQKDMPRGNHAALPWKDAPVFWVQLRAREALAARCLEFVILTAARSGEALGATWAEIDLAVCIWTVPATRMKARKEHEVPLSKAAVALLTALRPETPHPGERVFAVAGVARSNMAMAMLLRRMGRADLTTHGFRSTFRDWAGANTAHPREVIEHALAHQLKDKAEAAYARGDLLRKRVALMDDWTRYCAATAPDGADAMST